MISVAIRVFGTPAPQGSKTGFTVQSKATGKVKAVVVEGGSASGRAKQKSWRTEVALAAQRVAQKRGLEAPLDGPIHVDITFLLQRPPSASKRMYPHVKPDLDKLVRATLDSLTGLVIRDDARVVSLSTVKQYATMALPEGALIRVSLLDD